MSTGAWVAIAAVVIALAFGLYRARTDGQFTNARAKAVERPKMVEPGAKPKVVEPGDEGARVETPDPAKAAEPGEKPKVVEPGDEGARVETSESLLHNTPWADQAGERATLLQFSSAFCAPCRATRRILTDVAEEQEGITHIEVDAELHLDLVRRLKVMRTPTTIVLDHDGRELGRAVGAPTKAQVLASLPDPD